MPSGDLGDLLMTDWAQTVLFLPKMDEPLLAFEGVYHLHVEAFFIVALPLRVVRVGLSTDFDVSFDGHMSGVCEIMRLLFCGSIEHPIVSSDGGEVFLRPPCSSFSWMSSFHPVAHHPIDRVVYGLEGVFAHHVLMIECPSPDDGVKLHDQLSSTESFVRLHDVAYLFEEGLHVFLGRFNQQFVPLARLVLAYILAQEVKSFFDVRDDGFLC